MTYQLPTAEQIEENIALLNGETQRGEVDFATPIMQASQDKWKTKWVADNVNVPVLAKTTPNAEIEKPTMNRQDMSAFMARRK